MERKELERLLSKELDGELTPEDAERLSAETAASPDAERLAASWRRSEKALAGFISALGGPSAEARARVLAKAAPGREGLSAKGGRTGGWRLGLAAAAGVLVSLSAGFGIGAAVFARSRGAEPDSRAPETAVGVRTLREALRETQELMPQRVNWAALCEGQLNLGTVPLPLPGAGRFHFITFFVERSDRRRPTVLQIAVLDGEEARVTWVSDGEWSILCRPTRAGQAVRLSTRVSYRPEGSPRGVALAAEPVISGGERLTVLSSRIGGIGFSVSATVEGGGEPAASEGASL